MNFGAKRSIQSLIDGLIAQAITFHKPPPLSFSLETYHLITSNKLLKSSVHRIGFAKCDQADIKLRRVNAVITASLFVIKTQSLGSVKSSPASDIQTACLPDCIACWRTTSDRSIWRLVMCRASTPSSFKCCQYSAKASFVRRCLGMASPVKCVKCEYVKFLRSVVA